MEKDTPHNFGGQGYYGFENVTMVPVDRALIDEDALTPRERRYLDEYHAQCWARVAPLLAEGSPARAWLQRHTRPLGAA